MKRLAVIIPYYTTPTQLEDSLLSLLENRPDACDIFVIQCKSYGNPYNLESDEVHFLDAPVMDIAESTDGTAPTSGTSLWDALECALPTCNAEYVYLMPAGVQFQSCWVTALEVLDRHDDLGGFFLDENLENGGFFKKSLFEEYLCRATNLNDSEEKMPGNSDADCLNSLVSLIQEDGWACGLAAFEEMEEEEGKTEEDCREEATTASVAASQSVEEVIATIPETTAMQTFETETKTEAIADVQPVQEDLDTEKGNSGIWGQFYTFCRKIIMRN